MLRSFRVSNHKSIKEEQELLLIPAYDKTRPALPVAAIFGANAAGKSNVLLALNWMRDAVTSSHFVWEPDAGVPRQPYLLDPAYREPSLFAVDLMIGDVRHTYGFVVDDERVREEWLYTYPKNRKRVIFEREGEKIAFGSTVAEANARAEVLADMTRPNALLVSVAARSKFRDAATVERWFKRSLVVTGRRSELASATRLLRLTRDEPDLARTVMSLLTAADVGVTGVQTVQELLSEPEQQSLAEIENRLAQLADDLGGVSSQQLTELQVKAKELRSRMRRQRVTLLHGAAGVPLPFADESAGTHVWIGLAIDAVKALDQGSLLMVDEIDASLHPWLTARLIGMFHDPEANPRGAQLVFTSHDATLLGTLGGEDILRRDEVWFVEKTDGATHLFPLTDFHPRKEESTQRRYLGGSYGAVPGVWGSDFRKALGLDPWESRDSVSA
jgi:hypothetical protein